MRRRQARPDCSEWQVPNCRRPVSLGTIKCFVTDYVPYFFKRNLAD